MIYAKPCMDPLYECLSSCLSVSIDIACRYLMLGWKSSQSDCLEEASTSSIASVLQEETPSPREEKNQRRNAFSSTTSRDESFRLFDLGSILYRTNGPVALDYAIAHCVSGSSKVLGFALELQSKDKLVCVIFSVHT